MIRKGFTLTVPVCATGDMWLHRAIRDRDGLPVLLKAPAFYGPDSVLLRRLTHEYELAQGLDPSRVTRPLAVEQHAGKFVLVLESGPDQTLLGRLGAPMDVGAFLQIAIGITSALNELHGHGLVHKDIKPEHVLLDDTGHVWLTGLGVASRLPRERQALEPPEGIAGTLAYMAPEQTGRMNRSIDSRSDLYAVGVTFYQMLTGALPFAAGNPMEWVHCHIARQPAPPSDRVAGLPEPLSHMVMKLLAKTAEDRYQSSAGLESDLRRCHAQWLLHGQIDPFPLGGSDVPDRLLIPERLYGRKIEVDALLDAFDRVVARGSLEFVLVSGYSGIGKTSVVHELHKALIAQRGLFAAGKFDQYKRDVPYATLVEALQSLMRQIIGLSGAEVAAWRDALEKAVRPNGQLIVDLMPEAELVLGKQPPVAELPPLEAQNRFRSVLRRFLGALAGSEHPLVLFLDDLQWLDAATLDLIEQLVTGQEVRHLLLIGAYRENEVGPAHPLTRVLETVRKSSTGLREIVLAALSIDDVVALVSDALHCDRMSALPLAQLVHEKTGGNPFFVIQFLTALADESLLVIETDAGHWTWDLDRIRAKGYTDNVVDLMIHKLRRLPAQTRRALEQFACVGSFANIATLSMVFGQSEQRLHEALWEARHAGLVVRSDDAYAFLHDRVQEAALAMISGPRRRKLHLKIGRLLLARYPVEALSERVFEVVDQFNRCIDIVTDDEERHTLCTLNAAAGRKARAAAAYASAQRYLAQAFALLPADPWTEHHAQSLALYLQLAECEYLIGNFQQSDELLTVALGQARSASDRASAYRLRQRLYQLSGRFLDAMATSLSALQLFGVTFPETDEDIKAATQTNIRQIASHLRDRRIADQADASMAADADVRTTISLISEAMPLVYAVRPLLWPLINARGVLLCLDHGNADEAPFVYSCYAMVMAGVCCDIPAAVQFSEMAIGLNERVPGPAVLKGKLLLHHGALITVWCRHFATTRPLLERAFVACQDAGDLLCAGFLTYNAVWLRLENGDPLDEVIAAARQYAAFARHCHNDAIVNVVRFEEQFAACLKGATRTPTDFSDGTFEEADCLAAIEQSGFALGIAYHHIMKQIAAYFDERYDEALEWADRVAPMLLQVASMANEATHHFYRALTLTALHEQAPSERQQQFAQTLQEILHKLKYWADNGPENFANRLALVSAEIARIEGRDTTAMQHYEQALSSARDNNFVHQESLAAELASRFYRARGFDRIADTYLRHAHDGYARWGAHAKMRQLERRHPHLRSASHVPISTGARELDIQAVVRASQAISGEIVSDNLLKTLMRIVLENAGARQGYLLLIGNEQLSLAAEARVDRQDIVVSVAGDPGFGEASLPASIINFVRRSRDTVLLDNAAGPNPHSMDEYFMRHRPKSVLCVPIVRQDRLIGLLYLENDLATHAFTTDRVAVLRLLSAQAAISLENALVYDSMREGEALYRSLIEAIPNPFYYKAFDGRYLGCNVAFERQVRLKRENIIGRTVHELLPKELADAHVAGDKALIEHPGSFVHEARILASDGSVRDVVSHKATVTRADGTPMGIAGITFDITERNQAHKAMAEYALIVESTDDAIIGKTLDGIITSWNKGAERMLGYRADEIIGRSILTLIPDDRQGEEKAMLEVIQRGQPVRYIETVRRRKDGRLIEVSVTVSPLKNRQGEIVGASKIARDITERKQAEAERAARQVAEAANQAKSAFLANMSHELRTPLNGILGFAQILQHDKPLTVRQARGLKIIDESGRHLLALINDILDLARIDAAKLELCATAVNLPAFLQVVCDIVRLKAEEKSLLFIYEAATDLPSTVHADEKRLRQVLLNLLSNAIKFTDSGRVRLRVTRTPDSPAAGSARLRFEVEDNGIGMSEEQLTKLFTPFEQVGEVRRREGGTGLGLAISRQLIRLMGGDIAVHSQPGVGSVFSFEIEVPALSIGVQAHVDQGPPIGYEGERKKILVVDDVPQNRTMLVDALGLLGFQMADAGDGKEALELVAQFQPDLVLMDLMMPVMDGFEATRRLRSASATARLPVIATSASATPETEARSRDAGASVFLAKPIDRAALFNALAALLNLTWIRDTPTSAAHAPAHADDANLVPPPPEEIAVLREMARTGNMRLISERADYVKSLDPRYAAFATRLHSLAEGFQSKAIVDLIERFGPALVPQPVR